MLLEVLSLGPALLRVQSLLPGHPRRRARARSIVRAPDMLLHPPALSSAAPPWPYLISRRRRPCRRGDDEHERLSERRADGVAARARGPPAVGMLSVRLAPCAPWDAAIRTLDGAADSRATRLVSCITPLSLIAVTLLLLFPFPLRRSSLTALSSTSPLPFSQFASLWPLHGAHWTMPLSLVGATLILLAMRPSLKPRTPASCCSCRRCPA